MVKKNVTNIELQGPSPLAPLLASLTKRPDRLGGRIRGQLVRATIYTLVKVFVRV
jgi:hypothetical protein